MYKNIYIPVDNSEYSNYSIDVGMSIGEKTGAHITGSHVYSATLHDKRFRDMEHGLPEHYQQEERLKRSRKVHDSLIGDGLRLISDAYLDVFEKKCVKASISFRRKLMEGKNWLELVKDIRSSRYDLVIIGILGLGAVNGNMIGSVCERVVRRADTDVMVIKNSGAISGKIVAAVDGSAHSLSAFYKALALAKLYELEIEAVSVYDPHYHHRAFEGLAGVLSKEAGNKFKFKKQEELHKHVINDGLKKIYQGYLERVAGIGDKEGFKVKTSLLAGKPYHEICRYLETAQDSLLVVSRFGAHQADEPEIGNTAENLIRLVTCNVLMTYSSF